MFMQAKDVQMKKRPLDDFMDPRLKGEVNLRDFVSILGIAVLCVASSSRGRPTIKEVFDEMDRAWKNTIANMVDLTISLSLSHTHIYCS